MGIGQAGEDVLLLLNLDPAVDRFVLHAKL
jgi:hypothetical protein